MSGQQVQKNRRRVERGVIGPLRERLAHGSVIRAEVTVKDADGGIGLPWIGLDTLARMHRSGSINTEMRLAGERFHDFFRRAHFDAALFAIDPARVPAQRGKGFRRTVGEGSDSARRQVMFALDALGGMSSPGGSCAWFVLGCEHALDTWARSRGWSGRPISRATATGILLTDLAILQMHFEL
ncbi:MAG: hypothetical protein WB611_02115 [Stellaceae bacterium]